jgi:hypothetical protein
MLVTVSDTAADQEPAAAEDTAAVDDLIRTLVRMGLDQQTYFVTEAVERLEQAIKSGTAGDVETEARDVMTDAQNLYDMACAVAVRGYLGPVCDRSSPGVEPFLDQGQPGLGVASVAAACVVQQEGETPAAGPVDQQPVPAVNVVSGSAAPAHRA